MLAKQAHLQFVLEGTPARLADDKPAIAQLVADSAALKKPITVRQLTIALADNYGYTIAEKSDTWLFTKKYENPADFPELTTEEIRYFLRSVVEVMRGFNPAMLREQGIDTTLRDFATTLTPEKIAQLKESPPPPLPPGVSPLTDLPGIGHLFAKRENAPTPVDGKPYVPPPYDPGGTLVAALTPAEQQFYRFVALKEFVGMDTDQISRGLSVAESVTSSRSRFIHMQSGPHTCLTNVRTTKGNEYRTPLTPISRVFLNFGSATVSNTPLPNGDPNAPKSSDYGPDKKPLSWNEPSQYSVTLGTLAAKISPNSSIGLYVTPELSEKIVTVIDGRQKMTLDAKAMAYSLARLYNITLRTSKDGKQITLGLPSRPAVNRLEQVPKAIAFLMPAPLERLCRGWVHSGFAEIVKKNATGEKKPPVVA